MSFAENLIQWYQLHKRDLPWRETDDPYNIWVSEVMSQQTRVDTVIPYYHRFINTFPDVKSLASADRQKVLKLWEGLGYYSRCRNLHEAAQDIINRYDGEIPSDYDEIISLKGVGPYTAAAVLSIAYQKKYAVVDGNVLRVLARYFGISDDIRNQSVKNQIQEYANELISEDDPGDFNQALMELGATVCKPIQPECDSCPVSVDCKAYQTAQTDILPYKSPAKKIPHYEIAVGLIVNIKGELLIALRPDNGMLGGLWEFPGGKKERYESLKETVAREMKEELGVDVNVFQKMKVLKHAYSHFKITMHAYWCTIRNGTPQPKSSEKIAWVSMKEIDHYPFPKANKSIIEELKLMNENEFTRFFNES